MKFTQINLTEFQAFNTHYNRILIKKYKSKRHLIVWIAQGPNLQEFDENSISNKNAVDMVLKLNLF